MADSSFLSLCDDLLAPLVPPGVRRRRLLAALLGAQRERAGLDRWRVHRCGQSHHLDRGRLQLRLQAARQVTAARRKNRSVQELCGSSRYLNTPLACVSSSCLPASEHFRSDVGKTKEGSIPPLVYSIVNHSDKQVSPTSCSASCFPICVFWGGNTGTV